MEENTKKIVSIGIVVVCLILAVVIAFSRGPSITKTKGDIIMKCTYEDCDGLVTMSIEKYSELKKEQFPSGMMIPGATVVEICPVCDEESCIRAVKCEKCSITFFRNSVPDSQYNDTCPDCGYSALEVRDKEN